MLGRMFGAGRTLVRPDENGDYVIEREVSPEAIAAVLDYYRHGRIKCRPTVAVTELHDACDFFQIEFSTASVQCEDVARFLHELSNEGAKRQFHSFLQRSLVPAMARCADLGERQCHIVVLLENDTVEWDEELPPQLGEQYAKGGWVIAVPSLTRASRWFGGPSGARQLAVSLPVLVREPFHRQKGAQGVGPEEDQAGH